MEFSYIWLLSSGLLLFISSIVEIKTRRERRVDIIEGGKNE